jgi:hypothetical protein
MGHYRKKPVVVEAVQFTGQNFEEIGEFTKELAKKIADVGAIETLEGVMTFHPGDWIIKGVKGEFYPCKPDIFEATYEQVLE